MVSALAAAGVVVRPFRIPEVVWAAAGAACVVGLGWLPWQDALRAVARGSDVYLFLTGMMLLSETARREGVFDWAAARAASFARGSPRRLFPLIYGVGVATTVLLSNDATAVVLTPAVYAVARTARCEPLPFLFVCAFVANAASFVLPISNPANLVLYGGHMPTLVAWLGRFFLPSVLSIGATYVILRWAMRSHLPEVCAQPTASPMLSRSGHVALGGLSLTVVVLLAVSAFGLPLGAPTFVTGALTAVGVLISRREGPWPLIRGVSWSVLLLVGGLFVLVEALDRAGVPHWLGGLLSAATAWSAPAAAGGAGLLVAFIGNLTNNLPAGLVASSVIAQVHPPQAAVDSLLIGVDLGPNLSITGSLATILWLAVIRREGEHVGFWRFLKFGALVMPPALILAIGARLLSG
ncbi:MAG: arsenic transporter [Caulobacteraceae bacterium]